MQHTSNISFDNASGINLNNLKQNNTQSTCADICGIFFEC